MNFSRKFFYILIAFVLCCLIFVFVFFTNKKNFNNKKTIKTSLRHSSETSQLLKVGPYSTDVTYTFSVNNSTLILKANRLYYKKGNILGFKTLLFRQLVAKDLNIVIFKNDKKILEISKNKQVLKPNLNVILIEHPEVLFPKNLKPPIKVVIDRKKGKIILYYKKKKKEILL